MKQHLNNKFFSGIKKVISMIFPYIAVVFSAFLFSYAIRAFVNKSGLLTSGLSGVSLVIARYLGMMYYNLSLKDLLTSSEAMVFVNTWTSLIFFLGNIPLVILAFRKLGKKFAFLSTTFIIANSILIRFLPESIMDIFHLETDIGLSNAIFAGLFMGLAIALALKVGGSTGGVEILATYYSRKRQISIGKVSSFINTGVILLGGIVLQAWTPILFTLVLVFVSGRIVDSIHRATNKKLIQVISDDYQKISEEISSKTKYNCTISKAIGGYTKTTKYSLIIVVPEELVEHVVSLITAVDPNSFILTINISNIYGNFYIEPLK